MAGNGFSKTLDQMAIFGGEPAFAETLHVGRPNIGDRDRLLAADQRHARPPLADQQRPYVQEFERRVADDVGVKHCIAMCNGTVALEIAIRALGPARAR